MPVLMFSVVRTCGSSVLLDVFSISNLTVYVRIHRSSLRYDRSSLPCDLFRFDSLALFTEPIGARFHVVASMRKQCRCLRSRSAFLSVWSYLCCRCRCCRVRPVLSCGEMFVFVGCVTVIMHVHCSLVVHPEFCRTRSRLGFLESRIRSCPYRT